MQKISKILKRVLDFWRKNAKDGNYVIQGADFPDEYVRKLLLNEDLVFPIKRGLYLLKNKGEDAENLIYHFYWQIIQKLLKKYEPWSIEKESALMLHLGNESIPHKLLVRTSRKVKYPLNLPFNLLVQIRPDPAFHEQTRRLIEIGKAKIFVDVPERVLFCLRKRKGVNFSAFLRGMQFDRRMLEVLYSSNPKPVVVKELTGIADKFGRADLSLELKNILKRYTVYRS